MQTWLILIADNIDICSMAQGPRQLLLYSPIAAVWLRTLFPRLISQLLQASEKSEAMAVQGGGHGGCSCIALLQKKKPLWLATVPPGLLCASTWSAAGAAAAQLGLLQVTPPRLLAAFQCDACTCCLVTSVL